MTRYKWYRLGLPRDLAHFIEGLKGSPFNLDGSRGFIFAGSSQGVHAIKFAWKTQIATTTIDAEGNSAVQTISSIALSNFFIFSKFGTTWLRIEDAPRSSKELLDALESIAGFGFYAELLIFSKSVHSALLNKVDDCRLVSFKGVGSIVEEKAVARIEMAGKEGLDMDRFSFLQGINYSVDYALYEVVYRREKGQIAFSLSGTVKIGGILLPYLLGLVEGELPRS